MDTSGLAAILEWTAPEDPHGDPLTYAVFLDDQEVAAGLTSTTLALEGLEYETAFSGRVVASDSRGGSSEAGFASPTGRATCGS